MNKLAIFVEGQTEQIFVERLLLGITGGKNVRIEKRKAIGGGKSKRRIRLLEATAVDSGEKYFVQIVDCGEDERVKSDIREGYDRLVATGFEWIIGIRDVYPLARQDIPKLRQRLQWKLRTVPIQVLFVLAVMEIEAWFIAEHTHFLRISNTLTTQRIQAELRFDPSMDNVELRDHPAEDLDSIYRLAGYAYNKSRTNVQRTVNILDYARVYLELRESFRDLKRLVEHIDVFLSAGLSS